MARIKQVENSALKETWQHFSGDEMEMFGAHIRAYQIMPSRYNNVALGNLSPVNRAWTPYERFWKAVDAFDKKFKENPEAGLQFKIADYDPANRVMDSGTMLLDEREVARSYDAWKAIIDWNESKLDAYVKGVGGKINEAYGFVKVDIAPMELTRKAVTESIEEIARKARGLTVEASLNHVDTVPVVSELAEPVVVEKRRGAPKGGWPKKDKVTV